MSEFACKEVSSHVKLNFYCFLVYAGSWSENLGPRGKIMRKNETRSESFFSYFGPQKKSEPGEISPFPSPFPQACVYNKIRKYLNKYIVIAAAGVGIFD